jgi:hypothetical protein
MSSLTKTIPADAKPRSEKGAILFIVAACMVVLLGFMGLAIDLGHAYNNKSQLQNIADACALAGGSALNGEASGILLAQSRATDAGNRLSNRSEFNKSQVTVPASAVKFSISLNGPWYLSGAVPDPATIRYVKVDVPPQPTEVVFAKIIPGIPASLSFGADAVAGQLPLNEVCRGLDPFSPVRRDSGPYADSPPTPLCDPQGPQFQPGCTWPGEFGYIRGQAYELRLSPGNSGKNCGMQGIPGSVTGNFGFADVAGCGNGVPCLTDTIVNGSKNKCISSGPTLPARPGTSATPVLRALQDRFDQDNDLVTRPTWNDWDGPYKDATLVNNGRDIYRRQLRVAFNNGNIPNGSSGDYSVSGFGCFFMASRPDASPPSSAICLMFVGSCSENGNPTPTGATPSITRLVLYK